MTSTDAPSVNQHDEAGTRGLCNQVAAWRIGYDRVVCYLLASWRSFVDIGLA